MSSSWIHFFRDAGIPSPVAKSYATIFEDNRISRDMLLDLDKGILTDMGISVMGDIISILKHAKKVHAQDSRKRERTTSGSSIMKPSTSSPSQANAVSTTTASKRSKLAAQAAQAAAIHSVSEVQADSWTQAANAPAFTEPISPEEVYVTYQEPELTEPTPQLIEPEGLQPVLELSPQQYSTLRSDQLLLAVQQQQAELQQQQQEAELGYYLQENPLDSAAIVAAAAAVGLETGVDFEEEQPYVEEYTTAAYELQQRKRSLGTLYSDTPTEVQLNQPVSPTKQARVVLLPEDQEPYPSSLAPVRLAQSSLSSTERSRRMLEAAGLFSSQKEAKERTVTAGSVFSRLGSTTNSLQVSPPSRSAAISTVVAAKPKTVQLTPTSMSVGSAGGSTSRRELKITKVTKPRTVIATSTGSKTGGVSANILANSGSKLSGRVSSRLGVRPVVKQPASMSSRLGVRSTKETEKPSGGMSRRVGVMPTRQEKPSSSVPSRSGARLGKPAGSVSGRSSGNVSSRLGAREAGSTASGLSARVGGRPAVKEVRKPSGSTLSRLSVRADSARAAKPTVSSALARPKPSMVADEYEYEMKRQLDIRSRLEKKEQEKHARRRQPLAGRLEKHHVFGRLE